MKYLNYNFEKINFIYALLAAVLMASLLAGSTTSAQAAPPVASANEVLSAVAPHAPAQVVDDGAPNPGVVAIDDPAGSRVAERRNCHYFKKYGTADEMRISVDSNSATVDVAQIVTFKRCAGSKKRRATVTNQQVGFWLNNGDRMCRDGVDLYLWADPTGFGTYDARRLSIKCNPDLEKLFATWIIPNGDGVAERGDDLSRCSQGDYGAILPRATNPSGELDRLCIKFGR